MRSGPSRWGRGALVATAVASILSACDDGGGTLSARGAPSLEGVFEKVVRGELTQERPEVGSLSVGCTATLIAPEVVISAAHCFGFRSATNLGNYAQFTIESPVGTRRYAVQRYVSFSRGDLGDDDVALAQLAERVPAEVARPAPLAETEPSQGSALSVWGYGCTQRGANTDWQKRRASFEQGERTNHLCPGDSGGPVFDDERGAVLRINSGYWFDGFGTDIFGLVASNHDRLLEQVRSWSAGGIPEVGGGAPGGVELPPVPEGEQVCGLDRPTRQRWFCGEGGAQRLRCRKGYAPEQDACAGACRTGDVGADATCLAAGEPRVPCGEALAPYIEWTCTTDAGHLLRCRDGEVEVAPCAGQCRPGEARPPESCGL